tara:strand:- start:2440 stop:3096 length:657 start_codon:yes stop_codon:yes gene_type:complete
MIKFGLIFLLLVKFIEIVFIENVPVELQVFFWNLFLLVQAVGISLILHVALSYRHQKLKSLNFMFLVLSFFTLLDFLVEYAASSTKYYEQIRLIIGVILFILVLPACANILSRAFILNDNPYSNKKSFLIYKKPSNWCGMLALIMKAPFGHCSLVTKGKCFKFKSGVLVEKEYTPSQHSLHLAIPLVNLCEARKLLKTKWSLKTNCFAVFNKFKKEHV